MSEATEATLLKWKETNEEWGGSAVFEAINEHFDAFEHWGWPEIGVEGRRIGNLMFGDGVEDDSPRDALFSAIAVAAAHGAYASVAAALGVDMRALESAVATWYENPTDLPAPIGAAALMEKIAEDAKERAEMNAEDAP